MLIEVTQEDIEKGERGSCWECPVAIAVRRVADAKFIDVTELTIRYTLGLGESPTKYSTPPEVEEFIRRFDKGQRVEPFSFEL